MWGQGGGNVGTWTRGVWGHPQGRDAGATTRGGGREGVMGNYDVAAGAITMEAE